MGWPCGGLGYESKCWVGFDFQFDNIFESIWSCIGVNE